MYTITNVIGLSSVLPATQLRTVSGSRAHLTTATAQADSPPIVVEPSGLQLDQDAVESVPNVRTFQSLHYFEKYLVAVLASEYLHDLRTGNLFQRTVDSLVCPVATDAFQQNVT